MEETFDLFVSLILPGAADIFRRDLKAHGTHTLFEDEITFTKEGNVLTGKGKRKGFDAEQKAFSADVTVTSSDENRIMWTIANGIFEGIKRPDLIINITRVNRDDLAK